MKVAAFLRFTLEGDLRRAIGEEELQVLYQPIVDVARKAIVKAEALVRWPHLARGSVPPPEFISPGRGDRMIVPLTRAVMERVCNDIAELGSALPPDFRISINLSGVNFMDAQLIPTVRAVLDGRRRAGLGIEFELTETVLMRDLDYATVILAQLREMGIRVAVDDFGTGYSSLAYLRRLAVNTLKIDRSFVGELDDGQGVAIVKAVIGWPTAWGWRWWPRASDGRPSWRPCASRGCNLIQGYLFARPMSIRALAQSLACASVTLPESPAPAELSGRRLTPFGPGWRS